MGQAFGRGTRADGSRDPIHESKKYGEVWREGLSRNHVVQSGSTASSADNPAPVDVELARQGWRWLASPGRGTLTW